MRTGTNHGATVWKVQKLVIRVQSRPFRRVVNIFQRKKSKSPKSRAIVGRMLHMHGVNSSLDGRSNNRAIYIKCPSTPTEKTNRVGWADFRWGGLNVNVVVFRDEFPYHERSAGMRGAIEEKQEACNKTSVLHRVQQISRHSRRNEIQNMCVSLPQSRDRQLTGGDYYTAKFGFRPSGDLGRRKRRYCVFRAHAPASPTKGAYEHVASSSASSRSANVPKSPTVSLAIPKSSNRGRIVMSKS
jgi:hypothetical protein